MVSATRAQPNRWQEWLPRGVAAVWLWTGLVLLRGWGPWIELASHFVPHALLGGLLWLMLTLAVGRWKLALALLPPLIYAGLLFQPWALWRSNAPVLKEVMKVSAEPSGTLRVMSWNLLCVNESFAEIERVLAAQPVELLILIEFRPDLLEQLPSIRQQYPTSLEFPSWGGNGIAALSKRHDIALRRVDLLNPLMPSIEVTVGDNQLKLLGVHTWSPIPPGRARARDQQLRDLTAWAQQQTAPVCVIGDLNITPWAPAFQRLLDSGFVDSRALGFGNQASWPAWLGPLGIPIDHALIAGDCRIVERRLGPMVWGSDHRPVIVQLEW